MTTHEKLALLGAALMSLSVIVGWLLGHWRAYAECCDCCTCETCFPEDVPRFDETAGRSGTSPDLAAMSGTPAEPGYWRPDATSPVSGRRTVVLEPGPTIYRALAPLDDESLYGPESRVKPFDSTFIRTVLMDWERRYPIPQDSPNGNM